jgi:hypothetical protein
MDFPQFARGRPGIPGPRRVMTAPVPALSTSPVRTQPRPDTTNHLVETLYTHPSVRIISFTSTQHGFTALNEDVPPGSLPASSRLERTIAVGTYKTGSLPSLVDRRF